MPRPRGESAPPSVEYSFATDFQLMANAIAAGKQPVDHNHNTHHSHHSHHSHKHAPPPIASPRMGMATFPGGSPRELNTLREEDESPTRLQPPPRDQFFGQPTSVPTPAPVSMAGTPPHSTTPAAAAAAAAAAAVTSSSRPSSSSSRRRAHVQKELRYPPEISDHYDVAFTIGEGAFAKVKIACHKLTGVRVAIKVIYKGRLVRDNELFRAYDEVEVLKRLRHKNIVRLYQVVDTRDRMYLVMEYLPNGELFDYIVANERIRSDKDAKWIFYQAVRAVQHCHANGIAHRDIKPENLLLGERLVTKLCDFGLVGASGASILRTSCGSENYTAPEILRGGGYFGEMADIWSLGVVLFAMMCGYLPFDCDDSDQLRRLIDTADYVEPRFLSVECRSLIRSLLQPQPEDRPTIEQILDHPWLRECHARDVAGPTDLTLDEMLADPLGAASVADLATFYAVPAASITRLLHMDLYDHLRADFELLVLAKMRKAHVHLPVGAGRLENMHLLTPAALDRTEVMVEYEPKAAPASGSVSSATSSSTASGASAASAPSIPSVTVADDGTAAGAAGEDGAEAQGAASLPKPGRRRRAVSSPSKADAGAAARAGASDSPSTSGVSGDGSAGQGQRHQHYLKFLKAGSWKSFANSIRQKVSGLREQRHPKALGPTTQVHVTVDLPVEQLRDVVQQVLQATEGARTKNRGYRFHTRIRNPKLFRDEVKLLVEVCQVFGHERTEGGVKIARVKGEMAACMAASRDIVGSIRRALELSPAPNKDAGAEEKAPRAVAVAPAPVERLRVEGEERRRANSDAPLVVPSQYRPPGAWQGQQVQQGAPLSDKSLSGSSSNSSLEHNGEVPSPPRHVTFMV